ncbi:MAG: YjgN family protein [Burkholderiales bacterium]
MNAETSSTTHNPVEFTGNGGEYFRIWIVNLALSILTLGIYSAWAKVRRMQYFYRNTSLMGNSFDYHGDPITILKGRIIGVGLLAIYHITISLNVFVGLLIFVMIIAALPWLLQRSICFKLNNSSYRGLRFRFNGSVGGAYQVFLAWPLAGYFSAGMLFPLAHQRIKAYQHNHSAYGTSPFSFNADEGKFYIVYLKMIGLAFIPLILLIVCAVLFGVFNGIAGVGKDPVQTNKFVMKILFGVMAFYLILFLVIGPWFAARIQNLVWNHTALGQNTFISNVRARDLLAIYVANFLAIILTLGLYKPFADIRLAKYRLTHLALQTQGDLDAFFAQEQQAVTALGQEAASIFDVDISF